MLMNGNFLGRLPMFRVQWMGVFVMLLGSAFLFADDIESGPKVGAFMPGPFECKNVNGPAKDKPRRLVCSFALNPAVLVFAKEPEAGKDEAFTELLKQLDETAAKFEDRNFLVGVVIISPDGKDSTNNADEKNAAELIKEANQRDALTKRLAKRTENLKHVILGYMPSPPPAYKLNPKADVTVLFYERMKIIENYAHGRMLCRRRT